MRKPTVPLISPTPNDSPMLAKLLSRQLQRGIEVPYECINTESFSDFTKDVVNVLSKTESGDRLTYGAVAEKSGHPGAAQAVGQCLRSNPFPILIPCHRVVSSGRGCGGYGGTPDSKLKAYLLEYEKRDSYSRYF
ncbi:MAG: MGMT family protein [bacterium]